MPTVIVTAKVAQAIFAGQQTPANPILASFATGTPTGTPIKPFALAADRQIRFITKTVEEQGTTQNVVAVVDHRDSAGVEPAPGVPLMRGSAIVAVQGRRAVRAVTVAAHDGRSALLPHRALRQQVVTSIRTRCRLQHGHVR